MLLKSSLEGMSLSSGCKEVCRVRAVTKLLNCVLSAVCVFWKGTKCFSWSGDLPFLCNFKPISSPFLHTGLFMENFFLFVFFSS